MRQDIYPKSTMNYAQAFALREFCQQDSIPAAHEETLSVMTGRGYRPPSTVEGWRDLYSKIKHILG